MVAALGAFIITALLGLVVIPFLKKLHFGQTIREEGPSWHQSKSGTPTMGGIMIIIGFLLATVICFSLALVTKVDFFGPFASSIKKATFFGGLGLAIGMGLIGFLDDYIKVVKKRNLGLTPMQKTVGQLLVAAIYLSTLAFSGLTTTWLPFVGDVNVMSGFGIIFWPIALIFIYGFTNAVNLTDGIDGLASSVTMVVCCCFMLIAGRLEAFISTSTLAAAGAGACLGFLVWNSHPAKVFMGDTGSLFFGGLVTALAFGVGRPILLIFSGIIYLIEAMSVVLQVAYFKKTGKRIFLMSPIHHHFEKKGWSENKIVIIFSLVTLLGCVIALIPTIFTI